MNHLQPLFSFLRWLALLAVLLGVASPALAQNALTGSVGDVKIMFCDCSNFATCTIDAVGRVSAKRRSPDSVAIELSGYAYG